MESLVFFRDVFDFLDEDFVPDEGLPHVVVVVDSLHKRGWLHFLDILITVFGIILGLQQQLVDLGFLLIAQHISNSITRYDFFLDGFLDHIEFFFGFSDVIVGHLAA